MGKKSQPKDATSFRLIDITTEDYSASKSNFDPEDTEISIRLSADIKTNNQVKIIGIFTVFEFSQESRQIMMLESGCHFKINDKSWESFLKEDVIVIPKGLLTHLLLLSVGTARGIIHSTKPFWLKEILLPLIDVSNYFEEDQVIDIS